MEGLRIAADAIKILGRPTDKYPGSKRQPESTIDWYFNPANRHVAPALRVKQRKEGKLAGWKIIRK